jgi:hypothetical protein
MAVPVVAEVLGLPLVLPEDLERLVRDTMVELEMALTQELSSEAVVEVAVLEQLEQLARLQ